MAVKVEIIRPVNPTGWSFIKYVAGSLRHQGIEVDKELNKAIQFLGYEIMKKVGKGKWITGVIELKDNKLIVKKLEVWSKEEVEANIEIEI